MLQFFRRNSIHRAARKQGIDQELIGERIELLDFFSKRIDRACLSKQINKSKRSYLVRNQLCSIFNPGEQEKKATGCVCCSLFFLEKVVGESVNVFDHNDIPFLCYVSPMLEMSLPA